MKTIKFSHKYRKMWDFQSPTYLVGMYIEERDNLCDLFIDYDTVYSVGDEFIEPFIRNFPLPKGKLIVLILLTDNRLWTTMRRWIPYKEKYYRSLIGQIVQIEVGRKL